MIAKYDLINDGFTILKDIIPLKLLESLQCYAADLLRINNNPESIINGMSKLEMSDKKLFHKYCYDLPQTIPGQKLSTMSNIINLISKIFPDELLYLADQAIFYNKIDVKRLQYDWHFEKSYFPNTKEVITLWYPWLHKVNSDNGTMIVKKGSNNKMYKPQRENIEGGLTQMKICEEELIEYETVNCDLDLGDIVLFTSGLVHKTGKNNSRNPRTTMITRYTNYKGKFMSGWVPENK